jgi:hypothetical protein
MCAAEIPSGQGPVGGQHRRLLSAPALGLLYPTDHPTFQLCIGTLPTNDITKRYTRTEVPGRNLITAMSAIRMKTANTTTCVIMNGGSDCVGASASRAETFTKLCTTRTKTFK